MQYTIVFTEQLTSSCSVHLQNYWTMQGNLSIYLLTYCSWLHLNMLLHFQTVDATKPLAWHESAPLSSLKLQTGSPRIMKSHRIVTQSWKAMKKSWNTISVMEYDISHGDMKSNGKVLAFKWLWAICFHKVVHVFQIETLKFSKSMIFMQQMQYNTPNLMYVFQFLFGDDTPGPRQRWRSWIKCQLAMNRNDQLLKLIQHGKTRWNSVYDMFKRLHHLCWPVAAILSDKNVVTPSDAKMLDMREEN